MTTPQLPLGIAPRSSFRFEDFVVGPNAELLAVVQAMASGSGPHSLFVHGPPGSGRSHLLQAACNELAAEQGRAVYLPLRNLVEGRPGDFSRLGDTDLVAVDDLDAVAGRRKWEQAISGLYEIMRHGGGRVLASADAGPAAIGLELGDLISRLGWGGVMTVQPLDDEDRLALLIRQAATRGLHMPDEVGRYLLARVSRDPGAPLKWLERLDRASLAAQRRLTIPFVREVLGEDAGRR